MNAGAEQPTLERGDEQAAIAAALDAAADGAGQTILLRGPAGIGKSTLLRSAAEQAAGRGYHVLRATAREIERAHPFGVTRQLLEPPLRSADDRTRERLLAGGARAAGGILLDEEGGGEAAAAGGIYPRLRALYWVLAPLAAETPLLVAVDDIQWSDPASTQWIAYVAARIRSLPVVVIAAERTGEGTSADDLFDALDPGRVIEPDPLSETAVGVLLRTRLNGAVTPALSAASHRASGGNPFLVTEVATALEKGELDPSAIETSPPRSVSREIARRLRRLGPSATELAWAMAILGGGAAIHEAAALADLDADTALAAAARLQHAGILSDETPPAFVHALIAQSVRETRPPAERLAAHARAARVLRGLGAPLDRRAAHLLLAPPAADAEAALELAAAGDTALARGATESARALLLRAAGEPPPAPRRGRVLLSLGRCESALRDPAAQSHLIQAREASLTAAQRAQVDRELAVDLYLDGRRREAAAALESAVAELGDAEPELALVLQVLRLGFLYEERRRGRDGREELERLARAAVADSPGRRMLHAALAFRLATAGDERERSVALAQSALNQGLLNDVSPEGQLFQQAPSVLEAGGLLEESRRWRTAGIERAQTTGSISGFTFCSSFRSRTHLRLGNLADAEADARAALNPEYGVMPLLGATAASVLVETLLYQGDPAAAGRELLASGLAVDELDTFPACHVRLARAHLRLATGDPRGALEDARAAGDSYGRSGIENPAFGSWRSTASLAHRAMGDDQPAGALAREELEAARAFGAAWPIATALRRLAAIEGSRALLEEAVSLLEGSAARLEQAHCLIDLGALIRRQTGRADARAVLARGLDLAAGCGSRLLEARARQELIAAGARPRRSALSGPKSLTAQELRVAGLAAGGHTNREIAMALFITQSTVEAHLNRAYRKLSIASREELTAALSARP